MNHKIINKKNKLYITACNLYSKVQYGMIAVAAFVISFLFNAVPALAAGDGASGTAIIGEANMSDFSGDKSMAGILKNVGTLAIIIVGIIGVVVILKGVFGIITGKGDSSKGQIITQVIILVGIVLLILAFTNIDSFANMFGAAGNSALELTQNTAGSVLGN